MATGQIPILKLGSTLLATIQVELQDTVVDAFQNDLLEAIEKSGASGLIIDISALATLDRDQPYDQYADAEVRAVGD